MLDRKRIALIHVAKARLGIDDAGYRAMLARIANVESARDLDDMTFDWVMAEFQRLGFRSDFGRRNLGNRKDRASPAQIQRLRDEWSKFTAGEGTDASLSKWIERQFKVTSIVFLDGTTARKAIGGLIKMNKRKATKAERS